MNVDDVVTVVGDETLAPDGLTAVFEHLPAHERARHRYDLDRQWESAESADELRVVHDADEVPRGAGENLLAGQGAAAALDEMAMFGRLVEVIEANGQVVVIGDFDADFAQFFGRPLGARDHGVEPLRMRRERFDEVLDRASGAYTERISVLDVLECGKGGALLFRALSHRLTIARKNSARN